MNARLCLQLEDLAIVWLSESLLIAFAVILKDHFLHDFQLILDGLFLLLFVVGRILSLLACATHAHLVGLNAFIASLANFVPFFAVFQDLIENFIL